jgi:hypothetical protein
MLAGCLLVGWCLWRLRVSYVLVGALFGWLVLLVGWFGRCFFFGAPLSNFDQIPFRTCTFRLSAFREGRCWAMDHTCTAYLHTSIGHLQYQTMRMKMPFDSYVAQDQPPGKMMLPWLGNRSLRNQTESSGTDPTNSQATERPQPNQPTTDHKTKQPSSSEESITRQSIHPNKFENLGVPAIPASLNRSISKQKVFCHSGKRLLIQRVK